MALPTEGSNSLADLAHGIKTEHEAVCHALKRELAHAITAGNLLIEAKALIPHGGWLPWLKEHCGVSERSAQRYMDLARHAPVKSANVADLGIELLTPAWEVVPDFDDDDAFSAWAQRLLDSPFNKYDFPGDDGNETNYDWIKTKLMHQADLPWTAAWCFDVSHATENGSPALRCCPWDDLLEAARALAPIASCSGAQVRFPRCEEHASPVVAVKLWALRLLGGVLNEIEDREHMSDERYEREWEETHNHVMARLGEKCGSVMEAQA